MLTRGYYCLNIRYSPLYPDSHVWWSKWWPVVIIWLSLESLNRNLTQLGHWMYTEVIYGRIFFWCVLTVGYPCLNILYSHLYPDSHVWWTKGWPVLITWLHLIAGRVANRCLTHLKYFKRLAPNVTLSLEDIYVESVRLAYNIGLRETDIKDKKTTNNKKTTTTETITTKTESGKKLTALWEN